MERFYCLILLSTIALLSVAGDGVYNWMKYDNFDRVIDLMDAVNEMNCEAKSKDELMLPDYSVSNLVLTNKLRTSDFQRNYYRNRTALQQLHQTTLANAYKYSFLFQRLNQTWNLVDQPSLFYYYLGLTADVTANLGYINGSAVFFDRDLFYPNFLTQVPTNFTIPLFGPRSWRIDDYNDPSNWLREPTNDTFRVTDYGAGPFRNYTIDAYKTNDWYKEWLPHPITEQDDSKYDEYSVDIKYSDEPGSVSLSRDSNIKFFGPLSPSLADSIDQLPVQYVRPYFDCGRSNKWVFSASAPIYDRLPRYVYDPTIPGNRSAGIFDNLRTNRRVGVAVADIDFLNIDINPCPRYDQDDGDNYFGGIDRCHRESTICKPLPGFGFQRGGYMCECRPGFRYPEYIQGPYMGVAIERATEDEYNTGFHCLPNGDMYVVPELNAEADDNAGIIRLPGSVQTRKKRDVGLNKETVAKNIEDLERRRRDVGDAVIGITKYSSEKKRFLRRIKARDFTTMREARQVLYRKKRVADFTDIPAEVMRHMSSINSDLGIGSKGRAIVSRFKRKADAEAVKLKRKKRAAFNEFNLNRAQSVFETKTQITPSNCMNYEPQDLFLPGDVKYGIETKLQRFGRSALRLSDFLSSFLQNIDGKQDYGTLRGDKLLKEDQLFSEVISVILAEPDIEGIGLFFDTDQFKTLKTDRAADGSSSSIPLTKQLFAPYAYNLANKATKRDDYFAVDRASEPTPYTDSEWFKDIKRRWSYNAEGLKKYILNPWVRADVSGKNIRKHEDYPLVWESAVYESGLWSDPYFDCYGYIKDWIVSYRVPFFGNNGYGSAVEFRGVVVVDVKLDLLDIEQCPSDFYASNAFMSTARCDYESTYCQIIENQGFQLNQGYRCDCKQGYEYPWKGANEYFYTGDLIEDTRIRYLTNRTNRYERLSCRMSSAHHHAIAATTLVAALLSTLFLNF